MPTFKCVTLGCKVNQYETEYLREALEGLGYREATENEPVDLCVVNTCTVTATSDSKSRKAIRRLGRLYPQAEIIVMGCYATRAPEQLAALPGVVQVVADKRQLPQLLARRGAAELPSGISRFGTRHRAYVKVQDGCQMGCAYCIIPLVRPVLTSRPPAEVLDEVRRLVDRGYREIVLTGIHLGHYGCEHVGQWGCGPSGSRPVAARLADPNGNGTQPVGLHPARPGMKLVELLRRVADLPGEFRVRLSSLEAAEVSEDLIELMAERPERICPHLHLPLQSGSDRVLRLMRRRWPASAVLDRCQHLAARLDRPALTTDVIVGFPGETEEDFQSTCRVVEQAGFSKLHVFPFSPRAGTLAADMPDQLPPPVIRCRAKRLDELGRRLRREYMKRLLGRRLEVLIEEADAGPEGRLWGTAERYVPVEIVGPAEWCGRLVEVCADRLVADDPSHGHRGGDGRGYVSHQKRGAGPRLVGAPLF